MTCDLNVLKNHLCHPSFTERLLCKVSPNASAFPSKNPRGSNFSLGEKRGCVMIAAVIVTRVLGLLNQECFSSWKFSSAGWLGKFMMLLFCKFCCQHSLPFYWKNNPCKTLILFCWCRKKAKWKTCRFFVNSAFHDSSALFLKHKIPLQHSPQNIKKETFGKENFGGEKARPEMMAEIHSVDQQHAQILSNAITQPLRPVPCNSGILFGFRTLRSCRLPGQSSVECLGVCVEASSQGCFRQGRGNPSGVLLLKICPSVIGEVE